MAILDFIVISSRYYCSCITHSWVNNSWSFTVNFWGQGISGAIKEYKNASKTVEKERSASNNAIKLLKDVGVKGKELKRAEKELNESLKTYKLSRSKKVLEALNRGLDDLTPSEKERLKINRENKIENLKRSIKSVFKKK